MGVVDRAGNAAWEPGWDPLSWRQLLRAAASPVLAALMYLPLRASGLFFLWILFPLLMVQSVGATIRRYQIGDRKQGNIQAALTAACTVLLLAWLVYGWPV